MPTSGSYTPPGAPVGASFITVTADPTLTNEQTVSALFASPPAIGGTLPAAATFTTGAFNTNVKTPIVYPPADSTTAFRVMKADGLTTVATFDTTNSRFGVNITPNAALDVLVRDTQTVNFTVAAIFGHNSTNTPAPGFGTAIQINGETSGTGASEDVAMGQIRTSWNVSDHPTRESNMLLVTVAAGGSLVAPIWLRGNKISFFGGVSPAPQYLAAAGYTSDPESVAYSSTPAALANAARLVDLNQLRVAYENLRVLTEDLRAAIVSYGLMGVSGGD